jgi:hypothetical protein
MTDDELRAQFHTILETMDQRLNGVDKRFDGMDRRFDAMEQSTEQGFQAVQMAFGELQGAVSEQIEGLRREMNTKFGRVERRLERLEEHRRGV